MCKVCIVRTRRTACTETYLSMSHLQRGEGGAGRRCTARLRYQIHASDEGSGPARSRTTRLRPQINTNEDGAGVACNRRSGKRHHRRGMGLRPQNHASEEDDDTSLEPPASLPDSEDMLREILLRLPLDLYSLPRASAVCKQWRGILADPKFLRRFYTHHRKPPLLGFFHCGSTQTPFMPVPVAPAPDRITPGRFSLGHYSNCILIDSRHGRVLVKDLQHQEVVVCDPITSKHHRVPIPPEFNERFFNATVLCAASDQGHVHGSCHLCPFKVVLVSYRENKHPYACVYSSETATWGNVISTVASDDTIFGPCCSTLVDNVLYWPAKKKGDDIVEFDLGTQNLNVIKGPPGMNMNDFDNFHIIDAEDGIVGLVALSRLDLHMWQRKVNCRGVAIWLLQKTVSLRELLKIPSWTMRRIEPLKVVGYDEDADVIFLERHDSVYMVQPKSMQARKLNGISSTYYCYTLASICPLDLSLG
ncbi:unnamed protein product [Triticum turgidum subsp. durum]|uniref:F-box domain-containing protein n=1 Tax=Triticum turgidum subsp. durum TaxID=4567 RepID=A0A9R1RVD8_TRITD|nr:unnamed protein product [Triticum turgidum subsp. durum]